VSNTGIGSWLMAETSVAHAHESDTALRSQWTMSRLENMPSQIHVVRFTAHLVDQFCASFVTPPAEYHVGERQLGGGVATG